MGNLYMQKLGLTLIEHFGNNPSKEEMETLINMIAFQLEMKKVYEKTKENLKSSTKFKDINIDFNNQEKIQLYISGMVESYLEDEEISEKFKKNFAKMVIEKVVE